MFMKENFIVNVTICLGDIVKKTYLDNCKFTDL